MCRNAEAGVMIVVATAAEMPSEAEDRSCRSVAELARTLAKMLEA